ncbi:putative YD repeat protein [Verrucomicrobia bacterium]|nr:putative YD repeat protein [Verrucomicrobiota bacterium]
MPEWSVTEPFLNLWVTDTPLDYTPAFGPPVRLRLAWHYRFSGSAIPPYNSWDGAQIGNEWQAFVGQWSCSWLSFAELADGEAIVELMMPAGGWTTFTFPSNCNASTINFRNNTWLELQGPTGARTNLVLHNPDGSTLTYGILDSNTAAADGFEGLFYISSQSDPAGNQTTFAYDANFYLTNVTAADGATFSLQYSNSTFPDLITGVTSSYGATVSLQSGPFTEDSSAVLTNIIDAAGINSELAYTEENYANGPIYELSQLITPYGTTSFSLVNSGIPTVFDRFYEITNAVGDVQLYGLLNEYTGSSWPDYASSQIPTNTPIGTLDTTDRPDRNTYYWNAQQLAPLLGTSLTAFDWPQFEDGRIRHWLATSDPTYTHYGALSVEQAPSPDGGTTQGQLTWYDYTNKPAGTNNEVGPQAMPSVIARVMPDGSTWFDYFQLLTNGLPTQEVEQWVSEGAVISRTNSYVYATNNNDLLAWTNALGVVAESNIFNAYHQIATNYDALGQMTTYAYDSTTHQLTSASYPSDLTRAYTYDSTSHRLMQIVDQPVGATNNYVWNSDGTVFSHTDGRGLTVTNFWDGLHRLTGSVYPDGTTTSNSYTLMGGFTYPNSSGSLTILDLTGTKDRLGNWTYYVWDAVRRRIFETNANNIVTAYGYCPCGSVASATNALGTTVQEVTTNNYDYQGNLTTVQYADGYTVTNTFDSLRRLTSTADGWGTRYFNYDNTGLIISVTNACGVEQETTYDLLDRPVYVADANGIVITNTYDNLDRLLTRGYPDGGLERFGYSARGLIAHTNQVFFTNFYTYDASSRKTAETNADGQIISYSYSAAGDLLSLTDGKNQATRWNYDQYGRVTNKLDQGGTVILRYTYDPDSRLTNRWSAAKGNTSYTYDPVGDLLLIQYPMGFGQVAFNYDPLNRLANMIDGVGTNRLTYTLGNQLLTETGPFASDAMTNTYVNRVRTGLSLQQPTGLWTNGFAYDAARRLTNIVSPAGSFTNLYVTGVGGASGYCSRLLQRLLEPNGSAITNNFDAVGRLLGTYWRTSSGALTNKHEYLYNPAGQRTNETRISGVTVAYTYDPLGQLVGASSSDTSEKLGYDYDAAWNLNWFTNNTTAYAWKVNGLNELTNANPGGTSWQLTYDQNGNLNSGTEPGYAIGYTYDAENRLIAIADDLNNSFWATFAYDGLGRLRTRTDHVYNQQTGQWSVGDVYNYIYDGWRVIQERSSGTPSTSYTRGNDLSGSLEGAGGVGGLLARSDNYSSGNWTRHNYYQADGVGSVTFMLNTNQAEVASYRYDPFGRVISQAGPLASVNLYQFESKQLDPDMLMNYFGYRWYAPQFQRWPNRDPEAESGDINLYRGMLNTPLNVVDRNGGDNLYNMGAGNNNVPAMTISAPAAGGAASVSYPGGGFGDPILDLAAMFAGSMLLPAVGEGGAATGLGPEEVALLAAMLLDDANAAHQSPCPPKNPKHPLLGMAKANGGRAPKHGGTIHNKMIDDYIRNLPSNAQNIRKNQQQVDVNGNAVGNNQPDVQYDLNGQHYNVEFDTNPLNSIDHFNKIFGNDAVSPIELNF